MSDSTLHAASRPWYREPWPWLLMAGPFLVVCAGFVTLWLAVRSDDGLVASDYYKRGLAINQTLSKALRAQQLAMAGEAELAPGSQVVRVRMSGRGVLPETLRLQVVHPTRAIADEITELRQTGAGAYEGKLSGSMAGQRVIMIEDLDRTWRVAGQSDAVAGPVVLRP